LFGSPPIGGCGSGSQRRSGWSRPPAPHCRWPGARQLYRASGLSPAQYESAGKRRDGSISREGSVALRRALIDLGIGLWHADPAARRYGQQLRARGKKGGVIGCAMANRANKIAYAMVRDQTSYDPGRWA
jgi:transposase